MHNNQFTEVTLGLLDECKELLIRKGEDYSTNEDRLDSFKSAEQFTSLTQWQCWEALFFKHIQSLRTYFRSGRKQLNEDIHHRIRDSINYLILLEAMIVEEKTEDKEGPIDANASEAVDEGFKQVTYRCSTQKEFDYIHREPGGLQAFASNNPTYTHYSWGRYTYIIPTSYRHRDDGAGTTPRVQALPSLDLHS